MSDGASRDAAQINTVQGFLDALTSAALLASDELATAHQKWSSRGSEDSQSLAKWLVQKGMLTKYQAAAIYQGKLKGLVFGKYLVLDKIGAGGMGNVFQARHRESHEIVAVKVLATSAMRSPDAVRRFQREAEIAARLSHPHIVRAIEQGSNGSLYYFAMEFVEGLDLGKYIQQYGRMPWRDALSCAIQAARALEYAHGQGLVHRDIKPGNLFLTREGTIKVLDLGLARMNDPSDSANSSANDGLTQTGQVIGTVDYMAPEQALRTRDADARADIYSLGCSLFRLLTGRLPFEGETVVEKILAHREQPIPQVRHHVPDAPVGIDLVLQRMLAKRLEDRYQTMREVVTALERAPTMANFTQAAQLPPGAVPLTTMQPAAIAQPPNALPVSAQLPQMQPAYAAPAPQYAAQQISPPPVYVPQAMPSPVESASAAPVAYRRRRQRISLNALLPWLLLAAVVGGVYVYQDVLIEEFYKQSDLVMNGQAQSQRPEAKDVGPSNTPKELPAANSTTSTETSSPTPPPPTTQAATLAVTPSTVSPTMAKDDFPVVELNVATGPRLTADEQRQLARDVLAAGGKISIKLGDRFYHDNANPDDSPELPLTLTRVSLSNLNLVPIRIWERVLRLPNLSNFLASRNPGFTDQHAQELISVCPSLVCLWLDDTPITDQGVIQLSKLPRLRVLAVSNTKLTGAGVRHVARCQSLRYLSLQGLRLTTTDIAPVTTIPTLSTLNLVSNKVDDRVITLPWSKRFLANVSLDNTSVTTTARRNWLLMYPGLSFATQSPLIPDGDDAFAKLAPTEIRPPRPLPSAEVAAIERAVTVELQDAGVSVEVEVASTSGSLPSDQSLPSEPFEVIRIHFNDNPVSVAQLERLQKLSAVRTLELSGSSFTEAHAAALLQIPTLRAVLLDRTVTDDAAVQRLCEHPQLELLSLADTPVTNASVEALRKLPKLRWLDLSNTRLTASALPQLLGDHPTLESLLINRLSLADFTWEGISPPPALRLLDVRDTGSSTLLQATLKTRWNLRVLTVLSGPLAPAAASP